MIKTTYTMDDVRAYATIVVDNNPNAVRSALNRIGIDVPDSENAKILNGLPPERMALGKALIELYKSDKLAFVDLMQSIAWNPNAQNYTTSPQFLNKMKQGMAELRNKLVELANTQRIVNSADGRQHEDNMMFEGGESAADGKSIKELLSIINQ